MVSRFCPPRSLRLALFTSLANVVMATWTGKPLIAKTAEQFRNGWVYLDSSDLELGRELDHSAVQQPSDGELLVGVVLSGVDVPRHSSISSARVRFVVDEVRRESGLPLNLLVYAERTANAAPPGGNDGNLSLRVPTRSTLSWAPEASLDVGEELLSPDVSELVSEVTSLPDWQRGNSIALLFQYVSGDGVRWVESAYRRPAAATLEVTFTAPPASPAPPRSPPSPPVPPPPPPPLPTPPPSESGLAMLLAGSMVLASAALLGACQALRRELQQRRHGGLPTRPAAAAASSAVSAPTRSDGRVAPARDMIPIGVAVPASSTGDRAIELGVVATVVGAPIMDGPHARTA